MRFETVHPQRLSRWLFALLVLVIPLLVGYDIYYQFNTPTMDFFVAKHDSSIVAEVGAGGQAKAAGLQAGDVISKIDGSPFDARPGLQLGQIYTLEIERNGRRIALAVPTIRAWQLSRLSLAAALIVVLVFWGTSTLLLLRRFQQGVVRLLFLLAQTSAVMLLTPLAHPGLHSIPRWLVSLSMVCFYLVAPLLLHFYITFPVRLGTPRQRRWGLNLIYGLALVVALVGRSYSLLEVRLSVSYTILLVILAVAALTYVYLRRATPDGRRRLRLIVLGTILATVPPILFYLLPLVTGADSRMPEWLTGLFLTLAPLSYLYATSHHNLFGIDRLLNRALVYALLSLGIFGLYLGPLLLLYHLLPDNLLSQTLVIAGLTLLVGLSFNWARIQVQRLVDHLFYGGWYDYPGVIETVSDALTRSLERVHLTDVLSRQVPEMMQLREGQLWIGEEGSVPPQSVPPPTVVSPAEPPVVSPVEPSMVSPVEPPAVSLTEPPVVSPAEPPVVSPAEPPVVSPVEPPVVSSVEPRLQFPLAFQDQVRALWTVGPRRDGEGFTPSDRRILQTLARQAQVALGNVLLVETLRRQLAEIRTIQHQLLRSREDERARLARDLHDGPIQALVGLNLQLGLLLVPVDADGTLPLEDLKAMRGEVRGLLAELRQVCAELRPPMLDTLGLGAALRALTDEWSAQCGVMVHLELPPDATLRPLPDELAVNLYRVVQEALSNTARHAAAQRVTIQLTWEASRLTLTIHDDGRGFVVPGAYHNLAAQGHFGLVGMQERVVLIGGAWSVESNPGRGTTLRVVWPSKD